MAPSQNCKMDDCPRLAVSFSEYCGEHLPDSDGYQTLLSHKIIAATEPVSLNLHDMPFNGLRVINQTFDSPTIHQVQFRECVFVDVKMNMGQLSNVKFINCRFIRCHWIGIELSEFD